MKRLSETLQHVFQPAVGRFPVNPFPSILLAMAFSFSVAALLLLETNQIVFAQESGDKVTQLTAACERKEAKSCSELAGMYMRGTGGVTRDEKSAFAFLQRACDGGSPEGCASLGTMYFFGKGTAKDERKALEFDQRACDAGSSAGCANLSGYYLRGVVVPRDEKRAVQLAQRSCDADNRCNNLGSDYLNGTGVKRDAKKAAALYERACKAGFVDGCYNLGSLYAAGQGVARDDRRVPVKTPTIPTQRLVTTQALCMPTAGVRPKMRNEPRRFTCALATEETPQGATT